VHSLEVRIFDPLDIDQFVFTPESDFRNFLIEGIDAQVNLFSWISVDFELEMAGRDFSVRVHGSIHSEAENIFDQLERGPDFEFSKERLLLF
jgi:hypothetical protein